MAIQPTMMRMGLRTSMTLLQINFEMVGISKVFWIRWIICKAWEFRYDMKAVVTLGFVAHSELGIILGRKSIHQSTLGGGHVQSP